MVLYGRVTQIDEAYGRPVKVSRQLATGVLGAAGITRGMLRLAATALRAQPAKPAARRLKDLRQGPDFLVTPITVADAEGHPVAIEIHGHMSPGALVRGDRVRMSIRRQRGRDLPPRAVWIENLATGRLLKPRGPTVWSHFGPALILEMAIGLVLAAVLVFCMFGHRF
jgi:hypothetical protein